MSIISKFKALYNLPMREAVYIVRNKITPYERTPVERILYNHKTMRSQKVFDFLNRYETVLERAAGWQRLDFADKAVMEVGCGPLLGFLPLAIFRGARLCVAIEPGFNADALNDPRIEATYFKNLWSDLRNLFGETMDFAEFMRRIRAIEILNTGILDAHPREDRFDIILSNSCLEHVHPLEESLGHLGEMAAPGARFLHLVNFANHGGTAYPFKGMYTREPEAWFSANGRDLNLKRHPDVQKALEAAGFETGFYVMNAQPKLIQPPSAWWTERYSDEDLLKRVVLYHGSRKS